MGNPQQKTSSIETFDTLHEGVLDLIRAADLYTVTLLAYHAKREVDSVVRNTILEGKHVSGYALTGDAYSAADLAFLESSGSLTRVGEQIVLATYTAIEVYLENKFIELTRVLCKGAPSAILDPMTSRFRFRGLEDLKMGFFDILGIHLPSFDCGYFVDPKSHFQPDSSWAAITLLSNARNQIAHTGHSAIYPVKTLLDAWFPFDFARRWVSLFDCNFNSLILEGRLTSQILEYRSRLKSAGLVDR